MGEFILICFIVCIITKCIIFSKNNIRWWKGLIPAYNIYILGKIGNTKKIKWINAILLPFTYVYFIGCYIFELWIIRNYSVLVRVNNSGGMYSSDVRVEVPTWVANVSLTTKYILIFLALFAVICWCIMMYKFTKYHKKSTWWILAWAIIPAIPYSYFAVVNTIVVDGKLARIEKVIKYD